MSAKKAIPGKGPSAVGKPVKRTAGQQMTKQAKSLKSGKKK
jgi:hypothetical protein